MGSYVIVSLLGAVFSLLPFLVIALIVITLVRNGNGAQAQQGRDRGGVRAPGPYTYKTTSPMNRASQKIRRAEARMDALDAQHEGEDCTFSYSTQDPNFSFNGRKVVDELAELRRKNEAHERHLLARAHRE